MNSIVLGGPSDTLDRFERPLAGEQRVASRSPWLVAVCGAFALIAVAASCSQPQTAGNATWDFVTAVQLREFDEAYSLVCADEQREQSLQDFSNGGALEFAMPTRLETLVGAGGDARLDLATEGDEVATAAVLVEGSSGTITQRWRVNLVKEDGWKVCSFELVSERPR